MTMSTTMCNMLFLRRQVQELHVHENIRVLSMATHNDMFLCLHNKKEIVLLSCYIIIIISY